ncbi:MAG: ABC transporter permease, partial [Burkholderiaceae bacterium]
MDILPILSTLKRHKTAAGLIVLQIALTCAIVCNALFLISQRIERIQSPSGIAEQELVMLSLSSMVRVDNPDPQTQADLSALRQLPGVTSVSLANQYPYGRSANNSGVRLMPGDNQPTPLVAAHYQAAPGFIKTMGLHLIEGRDFTPDEYVNSTSLDNNPDPRVPAVILNKAMADRLFPGESALGKAIYVYGDSPQRVVGVLSTLVNPNPGAEDRNTDYNMLMPVHPSFRSGNFVLRVASPAQRDAVLKAAADKLMQNSPGLKRVMRDQDTLETMRDKYYRQDRSMVQLLAGVCVGLLVVTA